MDFEDTLLTFLVGKTCSKSRLGIAVSTREREQCRLSGGLEGVRERAPSCPLATS